MTTAFRRVALVSVLGVVLFGTRPVSATHASLDYSYDRVYFYSDHVTGDHLTKGTGCVDGDLGQCGELYLYGVLYLNGQKKKEVGPVTRNLVWTLGGVTQEYECAYGDWWAQGEHGVNDFGHWEWLSKGSGATGNCTGSSSLSVGLARTGGPGTRSAILGLSPYPDAASMQARMRSAAGVAATVAMGRMDRFDLGAIQATGTQLYSDLVFAVLQVKLSHHRIGDYMPFFWTDGSHQHLGLAIPHPNGTVTIAELRLRDGRWSLVRFEEKFF